MRHAFPLSRRDWRQVAIRHVVSSALNGAWGDEEGAGEVDAACLRVADFDWDRLGLRSDKLTHRSFSKHQLKRLGLQQGDLLLEKSGGGEKTPVGRVVAYDLDLEASLTSNFVARVRPKPGLEPDFLLYLLAALYMSGWSHQFIKQNTGIQNLDQAALFDTLVSVPDLPTQKAIAAFLDRETARIDQLIEKKQRLVELLGEKANSAVELELAKVQGRRTKLRWIARLKGGAGFPVEAQGSSQGDLAFFKVKHIGRANADGTLTEADDYIDAATAQKLRAAVFPKGSIVLAKIGAALMLSRFRVLGVDACIDNNMAALLVNKRKVDPRFLLLALSRFDMSVYANPGAVPSLNGDAFMNEHLVLPTRDVQAEIVALSEAASARIARTEGRVGLSTDRLKEYRSALITAAVTGQIDVETWSRRGEGDRRLDRIEEEMAG